MKIAFLVAHLGSGGTERTVAYLSSYFAKKNINTYIGCLSDSVFYDIDKNVKLDKFNIPSTSYNIFNRFVNIKKRYSAISKWLKRIRPDVVICLLPEMAKYVLRLKKIYKFKLVTSERNNPAVIIDKKTIRMKNIIYNISDIIIFQTKRAKQYYSTYIQDKGVVIPNAIGNDLAYTMRYEFKKENRVITAVGRLVPQKDYETLLKAFRLFYEENQNFELHIFGKGPLLRDLQRLAKELGIDQVVKFRGENKNALKYVAHSYCYVLSSKYEGMPNALMEAMAIGTPCISTNCPNGPAELISNGENGLLADVGDVVGLSDAIKMFVSNREFASKCAEKAVNILKTNSIDTIAQEYFMAIMKLFN